MTNRRRFAVFPLLAVAPGIAGANAGIPMLAFTWPLQWLALLPVVAIEAALVARALGTPYRNLLWPVAKANLVSTLVGIPLAWAAMLALEFLVLGGMNLLPPETANSRVLQVLSFPFAVAWLGDVGAWVVYAAFVVLAIPFCLVSIAIERRMLAKSLPGADAASLRSGVKLANIASYLLLVVGTVAFPLTY